MLAAIALAGMSATLSGCASVHLYDEERDKQGQALQKAWSETDIGGYFKAMRAERTKLTAAEYDEVASHALARRDSYARLIVEHPLPAKGVFGATGLQSLIAADLERLIGDTPAEAVDEPLRIADRAARAREDARFAGNLFFVKTGIRADCDSRDADAVVRAAQGDSDARRFRQSLLKECATIDGEPALRAAAMDKLTAGGLLADAILESRRLHDGLARRRAQVQAQSKALDDAMAAYKAAVRAEGAQFDPEKPSQRTSAAAAALSSTLTDLVSVRDAWSDSALASKKLATLQGLLKSLEDGKAPADAGEGAVALALMPRLADDLQDLRAVSSLVPQAALSLRLQLEQGELQRAQARAALAARQAAVADELVQARLEHAQRLASAKLPAIAGSPTLAEAMASNLAPADKVKLAAAALVLLDTHTHQRAVADRKEIEAFALKYEASVLEAEANADRYRILIDAVVAQSAAYAATGIRGEDIAKIVNAVSLLWIGHGVNR
jgi:hypothetical protein